MCSKFRAVLALAIATLSGTAASAFLPSAIRQSKALVIQAACPDETANQSRRAWIVATASFCLSFIPVVANAAAANVDPNQYGDKELQIALATRLRQNLRDAIVKDPKLAPLFLQISIQAALNASSSGKIVVSGEENKNLARAAMELQDIQAKLKRSTEVTMADVISFAGAEAIESLGGPTIVLQLGKLDKDRGPPMRIYDLNNGPETIRAFKNSGLTEREVALLLGAVEAMERVVDAIAVKSVVVKQTADDNEMGDSQVDIPASFGAPANIYEKPLGQLDSSVFESLLKTKTGVWANDDVVREWALRYQTSGFFKDLPQAYNKLVGSGVSR